MGRDFSSIIIFFHLFVYHLLNKCLLSATPARLCGDMSLVPGAPEVWTSIQNMLTGCDGMALRADHHKRDRYQSHSRQEGHQRPPARSGRPLRGQDS